MQTDRLSQTTNDSEKSEITILREEITLLKSEIMTKLETVLQSVAEIKNSPTASIAITEKPNNRIDSRQEKVAVTPKSKFLSPSPMSTLPQSSNFSYTDFILETNNFSPSNEVIKNPSQNCTLSTSLTIPPLKDVTFLPAISTVPRQINVIESSFSSPVFDKENIIPNSSFPPEIWPMIEKIRSRATDRMDLAFNLLITVFSEHELRHCNISGTHGKDKLNDGHINWIKEFVFGTFPHHNKEVEWKSLKQMLTQKVKNRRRNFKKTL